jgi:membrane-bound metal-dependent hydrolase YbcI (DUF457 family)
MHVVTHLLIGWTVAEQVTNKPRDRALITWCSVIPDLDGLGLPIDGIGRALGYQWNFYEQFHRIALHGLPAAILFALLVALIADEKRRAVMWGFVSFHLHLLGDIAGSRGSNPEDLWPIHYFEPVSSAITFSWAGQWPLTSWQNTAITIALMIYALALSVRRGYSPVSLFSNRADKVFVETLQKRWRTLRGK